MLEQLGAGSRRADGTRVDADGSSLGAALAVLAAEPVADAVDRLVLLAPAVMFAKPGHHLLPPERIDEWRRRGALPFFHYGVQRGAAARLRFLRGLACSTMRSRARFNQPTLDLPGAARRSVDPRTVEEFAPRATERHAVAARRRSSVDCEPAAHVDGGRGVPGADRVTAQRVALVERCCVLLSPLRTCGCAVASGAGPPYAAQPSAPCSSTTAPSALACCSSGSYEIVTLPLEAYVARVLAGEAAPQ